MEPLDYRTLTVAESTDKTTVVRPMKEARCPVRLNAAEDGIEARYRGQWYEIRGNVYSPFIVIR